MKIVQPSVTLAHATPDAMRLIERMGRICYQSTHRVTETSAPGFVRMVITRGHESVLEHASAGFMLVTDRGVTHELVRHRIASFSQESTRYCNYTKDQFGGEMTFIQPPNMEGMALSEWRQHMQLSSEVYTFMIKEGVAPEIARSVLPNSLKAEIGMTCNFREWRHFLRLRTSPKAHPQMRQIAKLIRAELLKLATPCFEDIP